MPNNPDDSTKFSIDGTIKSKLDSIWSDLQTSLPTISFDNDDSQNGDDDENEFVLDEQYLKLNEDFEFDFENDSLIQSASAAASTHTESQQSTQFDTTNGKLNIKNKNVLNSIEQATKITKNIFVTSNTKLNMDLFDQINFGDTTANTGDTLPLTDINDIFEIDQHTRKKVSNKQKENDERILEKLHAFSLQHVNSNNGNSNSNGSTDTNGKSGVGLKYNNHPNGNHVETMRIDLRNQSNGGAVAAAKKDKKNCFEKMLGELELIDFEMSSRPVVEKTVETRETTSNSDISSDDSNDDDDDDDGAGNGLWIERYRIQRQSSNIKQ